MTDFRHTTTVSWSGTGNSTFGGTLVDSADAEDNREVVLATSAEQQIDLAIVRTRLKHLFLLCDQDVTLRTNTTGGTDTIAMIAGIPVDYSASALQTNPFSADVTTVYATLTGATAATLRIRILKDSTP